MNQKGTISKIEGRHVWISVAPLACCDDGGASGCNCASTTTEVQFRAVNTKELNLTLGDNVEVSSPSGAAWAGIFRLVVIPVVLFFVGYAFWGGWIGLAFAVAALIGSLLFPQNRDSGFPVVEQILPFGDPISFGANA